MVELNLQQCNAADCSLLKNMAKAHEPVGRVTEECFTFPKNRGSRVMRKCLEINTLSH